MRKSKHKIVLPCSFSWNFTADFNSLGELISSHRTNRGILQDNIAQAMHISTRTLTRIENNKATITLEELFKIAVLFKVRPEYLLAELTRITGHDWDTSGEE